MRVAITNSSINVLDDKSSGAEKFGYEVAFRRSLTDGAAEEVVHGLFRQLSIDSFDVTSRYATENGVLASLKLEEWCPFARHVRNAFAHGQKWKISDSKALPISWRGMEIHKALDEQPIEREFLKWVDGLQLHAVMLNWVSGAGRTISDSPG